MIFIFGFLIISIIGGALAFIARKHNEVGFCMFVIAGLLFFLSAAVAGSNISNRTSATVKYNTMILYQEAVENSNDEALRFDYYSKVEDWNNHYSKVLARATNPWTRWLFVPDIDLSEVNTIEFELKR